MDKHSSNHNNLNNYSNNSSSIASNYNNHNLDYQDDNLENDFLDININDNKKKKRPLDTLKYILKTLFISEVDEDF